MNGCLRVGFALLATFVISACGTAPLKRSAVESLKEVTLVRTATPELAVPTFLQEAVRAGALGGFVPTAIADGQEKKVFGHEDNSVPDFGHLLATKLQEKIRVKAPWFPKVKYQTNPVAESEKLTQLAWLRIHVSEYKISSGFGTVFIQTTTQLQSADGQILWSYHDIYSGVAHGGEKIDLEKAKIDKSQLNREINRAADFMSERIAAGL